jgi:hypothetical protein
MNNTLIKYWITLSHRKCDTERFTDLGKLNLLIGSLILGFSQLFTIQSNDQFSQSCVYVEQLK